MTESWLEQIAADSEIAINTGDLDFILSHLANNAVLTMSFPERPDIPKLTFSKENYAQYLQEMWNKYKNIKIHRLSTNYKIADDGQTAMATIKVHQEATLADTGDVFISESLQISQIQLVEGIPITTKVDGTTTQEFQPDPRPYLDNARY